MTAGPTASDDALLSVDELSERTGISVRNLRFYTTRGLVPPPLRQGRTAGYTAAHVARFELVRDLQAQGFTLAAIESYLERIPQDASPDQVALHQVLMQPFVAEQPVTAGRRTLDRHAGRRVRDDELAQLLELGVVEEVAGKYRFLESRLQSAVRLLELDIPADLVQDTNEVYRRHSRAMAEELQQIFRERLWPAYKSGELGSEQVVRMLEDFQRSAVSQLVETFSEAMTEARMAEVARRTR